MYYNGTSVGVSYQWLDFYDTYNSNLKLAKDNSENLHFTYSLGDYSLIYLNSVNYGQSWNGPVTIASSSGWPTQNITPTISFDLKTNICYLC